MGSAPGPEPAPDLVSRLSLGRRILLVPEILAIYCLVRLRLFRDRFPIALAGVRELSDGGARGLPVAGEGEKGGHIQDASAVVVYLRAAQLARAVQRTLRLVPADARCLMQSLVLTALLARRGIDTKLLIGVNTGDQFEAHAWVEYRGYALLPDSQGIYHVLAEL